LLFRFPAENTPPGHVQNCADQESYFAGSTGEFMPLKAVGHPEIQFRRETGRHFQLQALELQRLAGWQSTCIYGCF
jgi:hypothetical protein